MNKKNITIAGSGLVGSLLSIYLAKKGHTINLFERRADMRKENMSAGKSINLALSDRGWKGLEGVGIADEIRKIAIPMYARCIHHKDGSTVLQPYGKKDQAIYSVSRATINKTLMTLAETQPNVKIHFNEKCIGVDKKTGTIEFENHDTHKITKITSDLIFGADGAFSSVRSSLQHTSDRFEYNQHYIDCGYKELEIPAGPNNSFVLEQNALHIWPRGSYMMIALPNPGGNFTCTLFLQFEEEKSFAKLKTREDVSAFFKAEFPDAVALMPNLLDDFFENPTASLVTVKCWPWVFENKVALIGDAAHAIVPFYGQGMNCGFEDCVVLNDLLEKDPDNWESVLKKYQQLRKPDGDAIADLAIMNFIEMRDKTADPSFLLQKKIEAKFSANHPDKWIPLYSMVTYSPHIRYSTALKEGARQEEIMREVMKLPNIEKEWDSAEIEKEILSRLKS